MHQSEQIKVSSSQELSKLKSKNLVLTSSSIFSQFFFTWISPIIVYASKNILEQEAIPDLPEKQKSSNQAGILINTFDAELRSGTKNRQGMKLLKAILKASKGYIFPSFFSYLLTVSSEMAAPIITQKVIIYIQNDQKTLSMSLMFVALIFFSRFIFNIALANLCYRMDLFGISVTNTLSICIFNKSLKFPTLCNKSVSTGELINYTEVDAQRFTDVGWNLASIVFCPSVLLFGIVYMYINIGLSFMAGMLVMVLVIIGIYFLTKLLNKANDKLLESKDDRMKITTEIFSNIRFIKSNAWEKYYFNKLNRSRNVQLSKLKKINILEVIKAFMIWLTTPLSISATFAAFVLMGNTLTAPIAFSTIVLFNILEYPMRTFPSAIGKLSQAYSSIKRIEKFLKIEEMENGYIKETEKDQGSQIAVKIENGSFYWELERGKSQSVEPKEKLSKDKKKKQSKKSQIISSQQSQNQIKQSLLSNDSLIIPNTIDPLSIPHVKALKNLNINIKKGKLTMVVGGVGSGKSSLLYSILGQMKAYPESNASIQIDGSIAYVPQKSWVMSKNVEQNILMTLPKDQTLMNSALKYSCLDTDLKQFPDNINTIIGEKGINLSGGQKARVCLARALYSNKDIYLLDDIISAVDVHVGDRIIKECILEYLREKTVVLVTHAILFAKYADEIIIMKKGEVVDVGNYEQLKDTSFFKQIEEEQNKKKEEQEEKQQEKSKLDTLPIPSLAQQISIQSDKGNKELVSNQVVSQLLLPQDRSRGQIKFKTYLKFIQFNGGAIFVITILICMSLYVALSIFSNIQIKKWTETEQQGLRNLYIFMGLSVMAGVFSSLRAAYIYYSGLKQSSIVHKKMIKGLVYASVPQFYDRVPTGRILNRVSKDLRELDENINVSLGYVVICFFGLVANIIICIYASTPFVLIPAVVLLIVSFFFKRYYMKCKREIVRIQSVSNSPILSSFTQVVNGLANIRAYKLQSNFYNKQCELVDINKRNKMCREAVGVWFQERLGIMSLIITITSTAYCIFSEQSSPTLAGLLLAYASSIDQSIVWLNVNMTDLESKMVSVERVSTFMEIEPENGYVEYTKKWRTLDEEVEKAIKQGKVEFKGLKLRYRESLPFVLKEINLIINPGEKIGVVGRTGAGKSTIIMSLLRMIEPSQGEILIDGQSIIDIPLKQLRNSLTLISQEPVLIAGTLRENLDPRNQNSDQQLLTALQQCNLLELFKQRQLLSTLISQSGENLSIGQKQLICITRAILRHNKLVLIDEATANIDMKADQLIQETIRSSFKDSTVITIAHRIKTILDSDRILVLQKGRVAEFDTPERLLEHKGIFWEMYQKSMEQKQ